MIGKHSHNCRLELETLEDRTVPSTVAADYPDGVWRWDSSAGWAHLTTNQSTGVLRVDDAGNVFGRFVDGLWRWDHNTGWAKLSSLTVQDFQVTGGGVLYGDFGTQGVWRWSFDGWQKLSSFDVHAIAVSDSDTFFGSFGGAVQGTWRWTPLAGWSHLSSTEADRLKTDAAGDLVGVYSALNINSALVGTWRWTASSSWQRLSTAVPDDFDVSDNGWVYELRSQGIYSLSPASGATFNFVANRALLTTITALPDGSVVYSEPGAAGPNYQMLYYNPTTQDAAFIVSGLQFGPAAVGKDGDIFFWERTAQWSPMISYHALGGENISGAVASQR
jgi:hypothetical protein